MLVDISKMISKTLELCVTKNWRDADEHQQDVDRRLCESERLAIRRQ